MHTVFGKAADREDSAVSELTSLERGRESKAAGIPEKAARLPLEIAYR